jgi:2-hydroxy-6-oxonona-2,4-dienedioate hydrolase
MNLNDEYNPERYTFVNGYRVRYYDSNNTLVAYQSNSITGGTLILLPGLGGSIEKYLSVLPILSEYFRVIVLDIIGFGYSDKPRVKYTIELFVDFLKKFLEKLQISNNKVSIVGSSLGGLIAAGFAIKFSNMIDKLILVSPAITNRLLPTHEGHNYIYAARIAGRRYIAASYTQIYKIVEEAFRNLFYRYDNIVTGAMIKDFINRMRLDYAVEAFNSTLEGIESFNTRLQVKLSKISSPTKIIWGENDLIIPFDYSTAALQIPGSTRAEIKKCGHNPPLEEPIKFSEIALEFFTGQNIKITNHKEQYKRYHQCAICGLGIWCPPDRCIYDNTFECKRFRVCEDMCHEYELAKLALEKGKEGKMY